MRSRLIFFLRIKVGFSPKKVFSKAFLIEITMIRAKKDIFFVSDRKEIHVAQEE